MSGHAAADPLVRNNVTVTGDPDGPPVVLVHGFGCDQNMWARVVPGLSDFRLVLLDLVGAGGSDVAAYDRARYDSLDGHADDLVEVLHALDLHGVTLVGHSVSAMISVIAWQRAGDRVAALALVCPSPRYLDDEGYAGGFSADDVTGLLELVGGNSSVWSAGLAPVIMGNAERPELTDELAASFCRTDPTAAAHFAEVTFLSDNRADLAGVRVPTLVLQTHEDAIAPEAVGQYVADRIAGSRLVHLDATGHCPHVSAPDETVDALRPFLAETAAAGRAPSG